MQSTINKDSFHSLVHKAVQSIQRQESGMSVKYAARMEHAPTIALVNLLIEDAIEAEASDIHLEPSDTFVRIRLRIDGDLCEMHEPLPLAVHAFLVSRIKIMSNLDISEHRLPQDGRILYSYQDREIDIRVSTMPVLDGETVVLRLLNISKRFLEISELSFSAEDEKQFRSLCHKPNGIFLTTGPVNSGKTTTLYAALNELNSISQNIITLEDPVEYRISGINQIQVNAKANLTFAVGLRSILRLDPDVIMVGEIRDEETANLAIRASLTGHLLFTTLHAADSIHAIFRLLEMGIPAYLLAAALSGILSQRLVKRICPHCRKSYTVSKDSSEADFLGNLYHENISLFHGQGCTACRGTGYLGRLAVYELLPIGDTLRQAIFDRQGIQTMEAIARETGMKTLQEDGLHKVLEGKTTLHEIRRVLYGIF